MSAWAIYSHFHTRFVSIWHLVFSLRRFVIGAKCQYLIYAYFCPKKVFCYNSKCLVCLYWSSTVIGAPRMSPSYICKLQNTYQYLAVLVNLLIILIWCNSFKKRFLCIFRIAYYVCMGHIQSFLYQVCFHLTSGPFATTFCDWCEMSIFDICLFLSKKGFWS